MTKRRELKCYGFFCYQNGIKHDRDFLTNYHGKNYCEQCLKRQKVQVRFRSELYHYIEEEWSIQFPTGQMLSQIKDYVHNRHYTYFGILESLEYMKKVKNKQLTTYMTLGYVPYIYEEAKDWWLLNYQRKQKAKSSVQGLNNQVEKIQTKNKKPTKRMNKVDMNNVLN